MTEESYQQCRKVMASINYLRGQITKAEGEVAKWTYIEDSHRRNLREGQANGAKKMIERAINKLERLRIKFDNISFPDSNIVAIKKKTTQCESCGATIAGGNTYCAECLCEDDSE